jgi:hypothetical protein
MQILEKVIFQISWYPRVAYGQGMSKPVYTKFEKVHQDSILSVEGCLELLCLPVLARFQRQSEKAART